MSDSGWPGATLAESPFATEAWSPGGPFTEAWSGGLPSETDAFDEKAKANKQTNQSKCKDAWDTLVAGLPEPMREALKDGRDVDLIRWGVHFGMDVDKLTGIVFLRQNGHVRGYCKLTAGELKTYQWQWNDLRKTVRAAKALGAPPEKAGPTTCPARGTPRLAPPQPDNPPVDITGRYEEGATPPRWTFRVNQAGNHVEAFLTELVLPPARGQGRGPRKQFQLSGDLRPGQTPSFELYNRAGPQTPMLLTVDGRGSLRIIEGNLVRKASRLSPAPTLTEAALAGRDEGDLVWRYEQRPLAKHQILHLRESLKPAAVAPLLKAVFGVKGHLSADRAARSRAVRKIWLYLQAVWDDPKHGIETQDLPLARFYARTILTLGKWEWGYRQSILDWLQLAIELDAVPGATWTNDALPVRLLGLSAPSQAPTGTKHTYKVTLAMGGVAAVVGVALGVMTIEKTSDGGQWEKGVKESFNFDALSIESGGGLTLRSTIEGVAESRLEWLPPDFVGTFKIVKLEASYLGIGPEGGFVHLHGRGPKPFLEVLFKDLSLDPPSVGKSGFDLSVSLGPAGIYGRINNRPFRDIDYTKSVVKWDYAVAYGLTKSVHFCLDSATLSAEARQAVRVMCANELPAFGASTSQLTITAHTDRSGTPDHNKTLSVLRAKNTLQAILDVLGRPRLKIPDDRVKCDGLGETLAVKDKRPDNEQNPRYRRVEVILNGRLVLYLRAD